MVVGEAGGRSGDKQHWFTLARSRTSSTRIARDERSTEGERAKEQASESQSLSQGLTLLRLGLAPRKQPRVRLHPVLLRLVDPALREGEHLPRDVIPHHRRVPRVEDGPLERPGEVLDTRSELERVIRGLEDGRLEAKEVLKAGEGWWTEGHDDGGGEEPTG